MIPIPMDIGIRTEPELKTKPGNLEEHKMENQQMQETQGLVSPGAREQTFTCKVKSHLSYNVYNVIMVEINLPGTLPVEYGAQFEAVDLTDDFINSAGDVPIGSIVAVSRVADKYVFQKP